MLAHLQSPWMLILVFVLPGAVLLFLHGEKRRRESLRRLSGKRGPGLGRMRDRRWEFGAVAISMMLIIVALTRPAGRQVNIDVSSEGRDVVFLLDVSRSMLAADAAPNRLELAKLAIRDCVRTMHGNRIALVAFAGSTSILCPLTTDYQFFHDQLDEVHTEVVNQGGTRIGDAITKTAEKLLSKDRYGYQDVILISDGEDQESKPQDAAMQLGWSGVHLLVIGVGDSYRGARVPSRDTTKGAFTLHEGKEVWSKLDPKSLQDIAKANRYGAYLPGGTKPFPLGDIYKRVIGHLSEKTSSGKTESIKDWEETFPAFLAAALVLLIPLYLNWSELRKPKPTAAALLVLLSLAFLPEARADSGLATYKKGHQEMQARNYAAALATFMQAAEQLGKPENRLQALYNSGFCCFRQAEADMSDFDKQPDPHSALAHYQQAAKTFRACVQLRPDHRDAAWNLELALVRAHELAEKLGDDMTDTGDEEKSETQDEKEGESDQQKKDGENEENQQDGESQNKKQTSEASETAEESEDVPPPQVEPEELLQQEKEAAAAREQQKAGQSYNPGPRDW